jgi:uncharacterized protein (DUF1330 family)
MLHEGEGHDVFSLQRFQSGQRDRFADSVSDCADAVQKGKERRAMPAYWVARSKINDPVEYKKYTDLVPAIIAKHGGKVLARGGRYQIMEGPQKFHRFIVIEFPTFEQGVACFQSDEYNKAAAFRRSGAGEVETIVVEGGDATAR